MISSIQNTTLYQIDPLQNLVVNTPAYDDEKSFFYKGSIPTPKEAGELFELGLANIFNSSWHSQIELAASRNGGLGNSEEGFLAWGRDGFFRFKNDSIPPELSARYAKISLVSGLQIESLKISNEYSEKHLPGKEEFATKFENSLQAFIENPSIGFKVDGGGVIYTVAKSKEGEGITFVRHKKKGWFGRLFEKITKWASPVFSFLGNIFPPLKLVSTGLSTINGLVQGDYAKGVSKEVSRQGAAV